MKRLFCILLDLLVFVSLDAQVQQGKVRTAGTPDQNGVPLEGVSIKMLGEYNSAVSDAGGVFEVLMADKRNGDPISIDRIFKVGYELLDSDDLSGTYAFSSKVPIEIVMKSKAAIAAEQARIEQRAYENAEKAYNKRIMQLDSALAASLITSEQRREELLKAQEQYNTFASLISVMSGRYARIDYDRLEENDREISRCISEGDLMKADSLINLKGNIIDRVGACKTDHAEIRNAEEQLRRATRQFERKKEEFLKVKNELQEDLYSKYAISLGKFQLDSACYYIIERAELDTADITCQIQASSFLNKYSTDYARSEMYLQRAIDLIKSEYDNNHPNLAVCFHLKGKLYERFAQYDKAFAAYAEVIALSKDAPEGVMYEMLSTYLDMGDLFFYIGKNDEALNSYNEIGSRVEELKEKNYTGLLRKYYKSMAGYARRFMNYDEALAYLDSAIEICEDEKDYYSVEMAYILNMKGAVYLSLKDYESAYECSKNVLDIRLKIYEDKHPEIATAYNNLGSVCDYLQKRDLALEYLMQGLNINKSIFGDWHPSVATNYNNISSVLMSAKRYKEAIDYSMQAIEIHKNIFGVNHEKVAIAYNNLANSWYRAGDVQKACDAMMQAKTIFENVYGKEHDNVALAYTNYAMMLMVVDADASSEAFSKARKIYAANHGENSRQVAEADFAAGFSFYEVKDYSRAYGFLKNAVEAYGIDGYDTYEEAVMLDYLSDIEVSIHQDYQQAISYATLALDVYSRALSPESNSAVTIRQDILSYYCRLLNGLKKNSARYSAVLKVLNTFNSNCMWLAIPLKDASEEDIKGLTGKYWLVRYNDWDMNSIEYLGDVISRYAGKPKTLLLYRDGVFSEVFYEDKLPMRFVCMAVDPEMKKSIGDKSDSE